MCCPKATSPLTFAMRLASNGAFIRMLPMTLDEVWQFDEHYSIMEQGGGEEFQLGYQGRCNVVLFSCEESFLCGHFEDSTTHGWTHRLKPMGQVRAHLDNYE
jgi:hypothetical protein